MKQEVLNFKFGNKKDFFITSKNKLALNLISNWPEWNNQFFFLYGPGKCGKTSICKIWKRKSEAMFLNERKIDDFFFNKDGLDKIHQNNWIIDDVDLFLKRSKNHEKLLNLINILQEKKKSYLLMTAKIPPKFLLTKINDLSSRISSSLVVKVNDPDNIILGKIIKKYLEERAVKIDNSKIDYLINRIERSYNHALKIAKLIDKKSLESHSQISFNFLKKILEN